MSRRVTTWRRSCSTLAGSTKCWTSSRRFSRSSRTFLRPTSAWGMALADSGRVDEAIGEYRKAVTLKPDYADAFYNLATALAATDRFREAAGYYRKVTQIERKFRGCLQRLGTAVGRVPRCFGPQRWRSSCVGEARWSFRAAESPVLLDTLAAAYAEAGQFPDACRPRRKPLIWRRSGRTGRWRKPLKPR